MGCHPSDGTRGYRRRLRSVMTHEDPFDDCTHWVGKLPAPSRDCPECAAERTTVGKQQPNVQRKEPPLEES
jgi:hypothetical protein